MHKPPTPTCTPSHDHDPRSSGGSALRRSHHLPGASQVRIEEKNYAQKGILISQALDIIAELDGSLNAEKGGELAQNLHKLYMYCNSRLLQANLKMDTAMIDEVIGILDSFRSAFAEISKTQPLPVPKSAPAYYAR